MTLTVFVHSPKDAFLQATSLALISMRFVDDASSSSGLTPSEMVPFASFFYI